jgi:hypothetical protein
MPRAIRRTTGRDFYGMTAIAWLAIAALSGFLAYGGLGARPFFLAHEIFCVAVLAALATVVLGLAHEARSHGRSSSTRR